MKGFQATGIRIKELDNKVKTASEKCEGRTEKGREFKVTENTTGLKTRSEVH